MNYETWSPVYGEILRDFGFDREDDERARDVLADLVGGVGADDSDTDESNAAHSDVDGSDASYSDTDGFDTNRLDVSGETVAVAGAGPSLADDDALAAASDADRVFAASTAADALREAGIAVDCMVTDLDKNPETARELTAAGTPVAVHAHGDNIPAVREWIPRFDAANVLPTTQAEPVGPVRNFGGFTDGDRAAFLADHFGAGELVFVGWDFDDPDVDDAKAKKLRWAERLLRWLELRRGERFAVLDERRAALDVTGFPG